MKDKHAKSVMLGVAESYEQIASELSGAHCSAPESNDCTPPAITRWPLSRSYVYSRTVCAGSRIVAIGSGSTARRDRRAAIKTFHAPALRNLRLGSAPWGEGSGSVRILS
jgi:hypothetical protein